MSRMALEDRLSGDLIEERMGRRPPIEDQDQGPGQGSASPTPAATPAPAAPNYQSLGNYANKLQGYDMSKFSQPYDQWSEKYKMGAVQSHFDPLAGVSGEYLNALNSLGLANFSGGGDRLTVANSRNDPRFGSGGTADVVKGLKGQNGDTAWQPWFVDSGGGRAMPSPSPVAPMQVQGSGIPGAAGTGGGGGSSANAALEAMLAKMMAQQDADAADKKAYRDKIHGTVLDQIAKGSTPVDENDPSITQPMRAFSGQQDRALAAGREALAARAQHGGMPTGAFDASLQSSYENLGTDKGAYNAQLIGDQLKMKQAQLQNALSTGAGLLSAEEARGLQSQLAQLDARIKQTDLAQSGQIANRDLDIRSSTAAGQLDLANRSENNRTNMFYDQMGLDVGSREAALNQSLMQMLYGG